MGQFDDLIAAQKNKPAVKPVVPTKAPKQGGMFDQLIAKAKSAGEILGTANNKALQDLAGDIATPVLPILEGAGRLAGTGVTKAFDVINRLSEANEARAVHGGGAGLHTLQHSETPEEYQADTSELARRNTGITVGPEDVLLPGMSHGPFGDMLPSVSLTKALSPKAYAQLPGIERGALEFLTQLQYDPTTYLGGSSFMKNFTEKLGAKGLPALARVVTSLEKSDNPTLVRIANDVRKTYNFFSYKGKDALNLAQKNGEEGVTQFRGLKSIDAARKYHAEDLANSLIHQYRSVIKGLSEEDEDALYKAVDSGTEAQLPENLREKSAAFKKITDSLAHLSGDPKLRERLAKENNFTLSNELKRFDKGPRDLQGANQYNPHYVPHQGAKLPPVAEDLSANSAQSINQLDESAQAAERDLPHNLTKKSPVETMNEILQNWREKKIEPSTTRGLDANDPNLLRRIGGTELLAPKLQRKVIEARLRGGAAAISAADAEKAVTKLFGKDTWEKVPADAKEFFRQVYTKIEDRPFLPSLIKGAIDIPKVALFALPFRHMFNIGSLSLLADPSIGNVTGTVGKYARILFSALNKEDRERILQDTSTNVLQKGQQLLKRASPESRQNILGKSAEYGVSHVPSPDRQAAGWLGRIPIIGDIYKASNHALWSFDDAAKATRFQRLLTGYQKQGMQEAHAAYKAAEEVGAELINYNERSAFTDLLGYIFPFAAYRSKFPRAIAKVAVQHPERIAAVGRLSPAMVGDVQDTGTTNDSGVEQGVQSYLPLAETMRGVGNPVNFLRSSFGYPLDMAISTAIDHIGGASGDANPYITDYMTYGKKPDLRYLANETLGSVPGASWLLGKVGQGEFQNQGDMSSALRGITGLGKVSGPSPEQQMAASVAQQFRDSIDAANKSGDKATAELIQKQLDKFLQQHYLYVR